MPVHLPETKEFEIGRFVCPKTHKSIPILGSQSVALTEWPILIQNCPACGGEHAVPIEELSHPPTFGYE